MKIDFHTHTVWSKDCCSSVGAFIRGCKRRGLGCVAITDHNEIDGALAVKKVASFPVIVGEEISSTAGDIIGLFVKRRIKPGMSLENTLDEIRSQSGLVYLPHPFATKKDSGRSIDHFDLPRLRESVDIIETFNGRNLNAIDDERAKHLAETIGAPQGAGSDAHTPFDIGLAYVELDEFDSQEGLIQGLRKGSIHGMRGTFGRRALLNRFTRKTLRWVVT
jgi:predicted metal-dependent phosphoesterase TrpH